LVRKPASHSDQDNASDAHRPRRKKKTGAPTFIERERRRQILDIAARLFAEQGFDKTSLEAIAREAGISRGVIFYYFEGKRDLGEQTVRRGLRDYSRYVRERVAACDSGIDQLFEFIDACLDYQREHREIYLLYIDLIGCFGDAEDKYALTVSMNRRTREWLVDIIEAGQDSGEIGPVPTQELADVIQGFVDGLMEMCALEPDGIDVDGCKALIRTMISKTVTQ
jgi:AcrR family transcriptional regulator